jgi:uncharacterized protein YhjY with autotransporter beta-barrel domain
MQPKLDKMKRDGAVTMAARRNDLTIAVGDKLASQERDAKRALIALASSYNGPVVRLDTGKAIGLSKSVGTVGKRNARLDKRHCNDRDRPGICAAGALALYNP